MEKSFMHKLVNFVVIVCTLVVPLIFFSKTLNMYSTPKLAVVVLTAAILILGYGIAGIISKKLTTISHGYIYSLVLFAIVILANLILNREGVFDALMGRGIMYEALIVSAVAVAASSGKNSLRNTFVSGIVGVTAILALHSIVQLIGTYNMSGIPTYMRTRAFTMTGNPLTTLTYLVIGGSVAFFHGLRSLKGILRGLYLTTGILATIAAVAYISLMLPGNELALNILPYRASWSIVLDMLKSTRNSVLGVGLANFTALYNSVKPLYLNTTPLWSITPASASSELFHLVISLGLPGLITFAAIPLSLAGSLKRSGHDHLDLILIWALSLAAIVFIPTTLPILALFFISGALLADPTEQSVRPQPVTLYLVAAVCTILTSITLLFTGKAIIAEQHMFRAQQALAQNDGKLVYEQTQKAVAMAPLAASYRLSYSQVNLSLASALSQKETLSDEERNQVTTLVSQAIREGKNAASLRPNDVRNWQNLGTVYRNLINVADQAEQFAVTAYTQAIAVSPADPQIRVEYGGLLYQLAGLSKDTETQKTLLASAIQQFQTAIQLKPDYANGYYNLSKALESAGNMTAAYSAMQKAVASLSPDSSDLSQATSELETLKGKLPKSSPSPAPSTAPQSQEKGIDELSEPSPLPSPISGGPLSIPTPSE